MTNLESVTQKVTEVDQQLPNILVESATLETKVQSIVNKYSDTEFDWAAAPIPDTQKRRGIDLRNAGNFYKYFSGIELETLVERPDLIPRCLIRFIRQYPQLYALTCRVVEKSFRVERSFLKGTFSRGEDNLSFDLRQQVADTLYPFIAELVAMDDPEFK